MRTLLLLSTLLPTLATAQLWCPGGETQLTRDSKGLTSITASQCHDVSVQAHFLGSRGAYRTALTFGNPSLPLQRSCAVGTSCLKYTQECRGTSWVQGTAVGACRWDALANSEEISCACQAPDYADFKARIAPGATVRLNPSFLIDTDDDDVPNKQMWDAYAGGGKNFRIYQLFRTLSRWDLEDFHTAPDGDFNDYVAAVETRDCNPNAVFPPHTTDFGGPERPIGCVDGCGNNGCEKPFVAPQQPLRFSVALGIDDTTSEANRERQGRKMHLTVAMHTDYAGEQLAICPVVWLDWQRPRDSREVDDQTQFLNYGADSAACVPLPWERPSSYPRCSARDRTIVEEALPISLSAYGAGLVCGYGGYPFDESVMAFPTSYGSCGARTLVRDYELPVQTVDDGLVDPSLQYGRLSALDLSRAVTRVDLYVFRDLNNRLRTQGVPTNGNFVCPSGVNALLRGVPAQVAQVTSYRFNPPGRSSATPGFSIYVRQ